jgi:hypothetical protein
MADRGLNDFSGVQNVQAIEPDRVKIKVKSSSLDCGRSLRDTNWHPKENS